MVRPSRGSVSNDWTSIKTRATWCKNGKKNYVKTGVVKTENVTMATVYVIKVKYVFKSYPKSFSSDVFQSQLLWQPLFF